MANFDLCFEKTMALDGGYKLHETPGDRGGMTYARISRNVWPDWTGWQLVDAGEIDSDRIKAMVRAFYKTHFWNPIQGDIIGFQNVAFVIYDFAVNAEVSAAVKVAQSIVGVKPDGILGPKTIKKMAAYVTNEREERQFAVEFSLARIYLYKGICLKHRSDLEFLCGWINRVQKTTPATHNGRTQAGYL